MSSRANTSKIRKPGFCVKNCPMVAKISKAPISPSTSPDGDQDVNNTSDEPLSTTFKLLEPNLKKTDPIPYTFRVNAPAGNSELMHAKSPPFYLLLDHCIAVVWHLFEENGTAKKSLGISQLQWALYFLKGIKDPFDGKCSPDIKVAINAIEDALLDCYASMAHIVMRSPPIQGSPCIICDIEKSLRRDEYDVSKNTSLKRMWQPRRTESQIDSDDDRIIVPPLLQTFPVSEKQSDDNTKKEILQLRHLAASFPKGAASSTSSKHTIQTEMKANEFVSFMENMKQNEIVNIKEKLERLHSMNTVSGPGVTSTKVDISSRSNLASTLKKPNTT